MKDDRYAEPGAAHAEATIKPASSQTVSQSFGLLYARVTQCRTRHALSKLAHWWIVRRREKKLPKRFLFPCEHTDDYIFCFRTKWAFFPSSVMLSHVDTCTNVEMLRCLPWRHIPRSSILSTRL